MLGQLGVELIWREIHVVNFHFEVLARAERVVLLLDCVVIDENAEILLLLCGVEDLHDTLDLRIGKEGALVLAVDLLLLSQLGRHP